MKSFPGSVHLYALSNAAPDQRLRSATQVVITQWDNTRIAIKGPMEPYEVVLRLRWNPRWQTSVDGVQLTQSVFQEGSRPMFTHVTVPAGVGSVTLEYGSPADVWRHYLLTALGLLLLAALLAVTRLLPLRHR